MAQDWYKLAYIDQGYGHRNIALVKFHSTEHVYSIWFADKNGIFFSLLSIDSLKIYLGINIYSLYISAD